MKRIFFHLLAYVLIVAALYAAAWSFFRGENLLDRIRFYRFDPAAWKAAQPEQRYYMATFLIERNLLIGKNKSEIFEMLGGGDAGTLFAYNLGHEHGSFISVDSDWLELSFDKHSDDAVVDQAMIRAQ